MRGWWAAMLCGLLGVLLAGAATAQSYRSLTGQFAAFAEATADLPGEARIAAFRTRIAPLLPGFYRPRDGRGTAEFEQMIARSLESYPRDRDAIAAVEQAFAATYPRELDRFRRVFPGFRLTAPVYLLHSLGEFDAGVRIIGGKRALIFAVDGIAIADPPDALPMLFDHEFFHMVHARAFPGCLAMWCRLWREGLAVYAASLLNPGASDAQLGLGAGLEGGELRASVEGDRRAALCLLKARLTAVDRRSNRTFFLSGGGAGALPPRFGYYLGFLVAQRAGQTHSLAALAHMPPMAARKLVADMLAAMTEQVGGCATGVVAQP